MLFHVKMTVNLPVDMNPERAAQLKADERHWPSACRSRASGGTCGASPACTPTTACSTSTACRNCTTC